MFVPGPKHGPGKDAMDTHHSPPGSRWFRPGIALAALAVGLVTGGLGIAGAEEQKAVPAEEAVPVPPPFFAGRPWPGFFPGPGPDNVFRVPRPGGFVGFGGFERGGIHSEVTFENPEGKYQTTATQLGKVVSVSPTSITLESEDGYKRTYAVDEATVVTARRDGIDNLKQGDAVQLSAEVKGSEARAVQIFDAASMKLAHVERFSERKPGS
jgi:hypothetical protein